MVKAIERIERFILYCTIIFLTTIPSYYYIYPLNTTFSNISTVLNSIFGILAILYVTLCLKYRGYVEITEDYKQMVSHNAKTCHMCMEIKPERAHHCSTCKRCIKKMDHHCHWIGRCINYDNHGHFIRFLFFTFCLALSLVIFNSFYFYRVFYLKNLEISYFLSFISLFTSIISTFLTFITYVHLNNQMYLVSKNITFIEKLHCNNFDYSLDESPYNLGITYNLQDVLGPFYLLLLANPKGDGLLYKKRYDVYYWPKHIKFNNEYYSEII